ncbi:response regulator [Paenibacillus sedimenti]|uniref:Response regulator n=1 Tax=Paenibacillus sedimenti TaxID=2770274 RepID=A0A926KJP5_9BACL|nr:response regulator [Paenibacillus sedimenti]MBD0378994.1 response regulator [Paenibacillus sedimenti]
MLKLLIVDDEQITRDGLLHYIPWRELGIGIVKAAEDGLQALQISDSFKPDIVLTDVKMPRMDGIQFAIKLKEALPQCKVIFLSSYADKPYLKSAIQLQALEYLEKPVNLEEIKKHVREAVSICLEEQARRLKESAIELQLNKSLTLLREEFALKLISKPLAQTELDESFQLVGIELPMGAANVTVVVKMLGAEDASLQLLHANKKAIFEQIETIFDEFDMGCICAFKDLHHLIVHAYGKKLTHTNQLVNPIHRVRTVLLSYTGAANKTFTGIGQLVYRAQHILESYQTAIVALQRQFFLGYNQVLAYRELEPNKRSHSLDESLIEQFAAHLASEQKEEAFSIIKQVTNDIQETEDTLVNSTKNFYFKLLMNVYQIADKKNVPLTEEGGHEQFLWNMITELHTIHEVEQYVLEKLASFFRYLEHKEQEGSIALSIQKHVRAHVDNPELSIKSISEALFLTPNYLSLQFKKETGSTINQYITELRIERAQELLRDRSRKLYEIAVLVGFQDANYFAKTFKKLTGMTPSEYKEKYA